jgi:glycosyltransferase involved in cell wall biosynthesis
MKVLFLTNIPSPYRINFFNELGKLCDLTVWFEAKKESNREWEIGGLGRHFRYQFLKGRTFGLDKHLNWSVIRELNAQPFDIYILAIHWLKLRRKPFILNSDGGFPGQERLLQRKLKTYLISSAALWLSSGSNCSRYLMHYGASQNRIREYPLSSVVLSEEERKPLSEAEKLGLRRQENLKGVVLLAVGQFIPRKGFDVLLRAFGQLQRSHPEAGVSLLMIGGGPEKSLYEEIIRREGIHDVTIKDFMQKDELIRYWKMADLFVLPTRYDVWGLVFNEAAAFGLPIITTSMAGAAHDLVRDGENGFVTASEDVGGLARRCAELVLDRERRERFARRSREIADRYSMERMVSRHMRILNAWEAEKGEPGHEHLHVDL